MNRRAFLASLGGTLAASVPLAVRAEGTMPLVGVMIAFADDAEGRARLAALDQGLQALGWTNGRNIRLDARFVGADEVNTRAQVAELVALSPNVIVVNSSLITRALREATSTIPIVMAVVNDPVGQGFISSLAHPGGNVTGFALNEFSFLGKWLEILKEMVPSLERAAAMFSPETAPFWHSYLSSFTLPRSLGLEVQAAPVRDAVEIEGTVAALGHDRKSGLLLPPDAFTLVHRRLIVRSVAQHHVPAVYANRSFVAEGALVSYAADAYDLFRRAASYVDRILKGAKPADLPAQEPTRFELIVNLKTAKALGLELPPTLLARADEVIE